MTQLEKLEEDSQKADYVRQMLKSKGWAVLEDRLKIKKEIYIERMLKESTHNGLLMLQGKINGINDLLEEIENVLQIGNVSDNELKIIRR